MRKIILFILLIVSLFCLGVCGCASDSRKTSNRKKNDQEYIGLMKEYMEIKYSTEFTIVESILPKEGFNTGHLDNILVLKDKNDVLTNVRAELSEPYIFYDNYVESITAAEIYRKAEMETVSSFQLKTYATVRSEDITNIDISPDNISSLTVLGIYQGEPTEQDMKKLYDVYENVCEAGYTNFYFLIGFVDSPVEFEQAVDNYTVYGKANWSDCEQPHT